MQLSCLQGGLHLTVMYVFLNYLQYIHVETTAIFVRILAFMTFFFHLLVSIAKFPIP